MSGFAASAARPALALVLNAFVWGLSWWPFRWLDARGLHPLWATALIYLLALLAITCWRPGAWADLWRTRSLWWLVLAAGTTNACFNWGVTVGDVVRVVLLFYLMPLWAVLLARVLLHERLQATTLLRVALALIGAVAVLWPADAAAGALPLPRTLPEWLGVLGGFTFALNNVLLRRESHRPEATRALAMFFGGALVAGLLAGLLQAQGSVPALPGADARWLIGAALLALAFLVGNMALQYGAARLSAQATAVIMLTEVVFASGSAALLGAGQLTPMVLLGGGLIVAAAVLAGRG